MGVGVRYPEASTAWRTFSLRPSLLNVILFPKTGCDRTGTAWNPVLIAALWRTGCCLSIGNPVQVHGIFARANIAARTLDAPTERFLEQGQLKDAADDFKR